MKRQIRDTELTDQQLERELQRSVQKRHRWSVIKNTGLFFFILIALFGLITNFWFPIYYVMDERSGSNGNHGQLLAATKTDGFETGDVVLVRDGDDILLRRIVGLPGDSITIDPDGNLSVNGLSYHLLQQAQMLMGETNLQYPYVVPQGDCLLITVFQPRTIETTHKEMLIGNQIFCLWPIQQAGFIR